MEFSFLHLGLLLVLTLSLCLETQPECYGKNLFYDTVTRTCSPCSEICDNSNIQRTEKYCNDVCPGYQSEKTTTVVPTTHEDSWNPRWLIIPIVIIVAIVIAGLIYGYYKSLQNGQQQARDAALNISLHVQDRIEDDVNEPLGTPEVQAPDETSPNFPVQALDDDSTGKLVTSCAPRDTNV